MDDLSLLQDLAGDEPLPDQHDLAPARARLSATLTTTRPVPARSPRRVRAPRRLLLTAVATGAAAAVAAVFLVATHHQATTDPGGGPQLVNADAATVLNAAAAAALKTSDAAPRPDQFVYTKNIGFGVTSEGWMSVDGTHDGYRLDNGQRVDFPGCRNGVAMTHGNYHGTRPQPCVPDPAYRTDLPTDADAMYAYLQNHAKGDDINAVGKDVMDLAGYDLPPRTRAALYQAAARLRGLHVKHDVVDGAGRHGVAITWQYTGTCAKGCERDNELIFDPTTYAPLGFRAGAHATAILRVAVVDAPGQRP
jgi:hypothetical protein